MLKIQKTKSEDWKRLMEIWENSVKATHHFLSQSDFLLFQELLPNAFFPQVDLYSIFDNEKIVAFIGVSKDNLEMLFVDDTSRGKGIGKFAIDFIIHQLKIYKVDVNEQNEQAVGFYKNSGYVQKGRSELDGMGKPYPLLHLEFPM